MGEELLPGLFKMMDKQFGRFSRPISFVVLSLIVMGISAWALELTWQKLLGPIASLVVETDTPVTLDELGAAIILGGLVVVVTVSVWATSLFIKFTSKRRASDYSPVQAAILRGEAKPAVQLESDPSPRGPKPLAIPLDKKLVPKHHVNRASR